MQGDGLEVYRGYPQMHAGQTGRGLGGVLSTVARYALPVVGPIAAKLGRSLLKAGVNRVMSVADRKLNQLDPGGVAGPIKRRVKTPRSSVVSKASTVKRKRKKRTRKDIFSVRK
jgi:hypothetical protein